MNRFIKRTLLIAITMIGLLTFSVIYQTEKSYKVIGLSMFPTITDGDSLIGKPVTGLPTRGTIYFFDASYFQQGKSSDKGKTFIKRLVGLPEDTLTFRLTDGLLLEVNGKAVAYSLDESVKPFSLTSKFPEYRANFPVYGLKQKVGGAEYSIYQLSEKLLHTNADNQRAYWQVIHHYPWLEQHKSNDGLVRITIPKGHYFFLSDNRVLGSDSRHFGLVPFDAIKMQLDTPQSSLISSNAC